MIRLIKWLFHRHDYKFVHAKYGYKYYGSSSFITHDKLSLDSMTQVTYICTKCRKVKLDYYPGRLDRSIFE